MIFLALWPPKSAHNIFWGIIKKKNLLKYLLLCKWQDSSLLNAGLTMYKMPPLNLRADCVLKDLKLNSVRSPTPFLWSDVEDFFAGFWQVGKGVLVIPPFITQLKRKCCCTAHTQMYLGVGLVKSGVLLCVRCLAFLARNRPFSWQAWLGCTR